MHYKSYLCLLLGTHCCLEIVCGLVARNLCIYVCEWRCRQTTTYQHSVQNYSVTFVLQQACINYISLTYILSGSSISMWLHLTSLLRKCGFKRTEKTAMLQRRCLPSGNVPKPKKLMVFQTLQYPLNFPSIKASPKKNQATVQCQHQNEMKRPRRCCCINLRIYCPTLWKHDLREKIQMQ